MPVAPHILRYPVGLGLNEAARPELVALGTANLRSENIRRFRQGEARTRYGFGAYGATGVPANRGTKLLANGQSIVQIGDDTNGLGGVVSGYDPTAGAWHQMGDRISQCVQRLLGASSLGNVSHIEDIAYANGYFCIVWISKTTASSGFTFAAVIEANSGSLVSGPVQVGATSSINSPVALCVDAKKFICVRGDDAAIVIKANYLDTLSTTTINSGWQAMADLAANYGAPGFQFAVCSLPDVTNHRCALVFNNNLGGTSRITVKTFNVASGVIQSVDINTSSITPLRVDVQGAIGDTLWVSWDEGTAIRVTGLQPLLITGAALATTATIVTVATAAASINVLPTSAGQGRLFVGDTNTTMQSAVRGFKTTAGAAATNGSQITVFAVRAASRPFYYQLQCFIHVIAADTANTQQQVVLVDWTDDFAFVRPVACVAPGLALTSTFQQGSVVAGPTAGKFYYGQGIQKSSVAEASTVVEYDFKSTKRWQSVAHAGTKYLSGAVTMALDTRRCTEVGFLVRPPTPTTTTSGTGISAATGWRYVFVYEDVDAQGNWCVSGLSSPSASTGAVANKTVNVSTSPLTVSARINSASSQASSLRIAVYRTLDGGVAPYYRVGTVANDTSTGSVTFADAVTDAVIAANAKLYSQPGVLGTAQDRRPPPGLGMLVSYNGMLVGATGSVVWYSGQNVDGEGAWFNPIFQVPVPGDGDITALAVMDGSLFVFKQREIYAMAGDAPSDNGSTGGLGLPRRLAVDAGCVDLRSVCTTALGIFFQSDRGIEVLTRAQTVQWIGQHVQQTLATFPIVTSATVETTPFGALLLIELVSSEVGNLVSGNGRTLVFDLALNDWVSTDRRTSSVGGADAPSQSACMIYTGAAWRYAWMTNGGLVHFEDRSTFLDANGSFVTPLIETGWYDAFISETSVWSASLLFQQFTAAGLLVETAYDWGDYNVLDNAVWTEGDTLNQRQLELLAKPRGESLKFRISATAPAVYATGQGFGFFVIELDTRAKQGPVMTTTRLDPALRR